MTNLARTSERVGSRENGEMPSETVRAFPHCAVTGPSQNALCFVVVGSKLDLVMALCAPVFFCLALVARKV